MLHKFREKRVEKVLKAHKQLVSENLVLTVYSKISKFKLPTCRKTKFNAGQISQWKQSNESGKWLGFSFSRIFVFFWYTILLKFLGKNPLIEKII